MSLLQQGLPAHFFTRGRAIVAGFAIGGALLIASEIYMKARYYVSEPKTAPACYGSEHVAGNNILPSRDLRDRNRSIDDRPASSDPAQLAVAARNCTAQSCPREAWKEYRSAVFWYLSPRLQHTSQLYRSYGDEGLIRARMIYREADDQKFVEGLRERYAAGVFRLNDFRQNRAALAILVLKGADALRPCGKGEAAEAD
jgi:hypothetical protein